MSSAVDYGFCPFKARCTPSARRRQVSRSGAEAYGERVGGDSGTDDHAKAMR